MKIETETRIESNENPNGPPKAGASVSADEEVPKSKKGKGTNQTPRGNSDKVK